MSTGRVVEMTALYGKVDGACEVLFSLLFLVLVTHIRENLAPDVASNKLLCLCLHLSTMSSNLDSHSCFYEYRMDAQCRTKIVLNCCLLDMDIF